MNVNPNNLLLTYWLFTSKIFRLAGLQIQKVYVLMRAIILI